MTHKGLAAAVACGVLVVAGAGFSIYHSSARKLAAKSPAHAESGYIDSAACAECHREIAETYSRTGMARSFYRPAAQNAVEDYRRHNTLFNRASNRSYTMIERDGKWFQRRSQTGFDGKETNVIEKQVAFVIGSGNHVRTFVYRNAEGNLVEMPVSWYSENGGYWAMSPGYDRANQPDFTRVIVNECFSCHDAYPQSADPAAAARASNFTNPSFGEKLPAGIDCQRCHGPGRAHAEAARSGKSTPGAVRHLIVNPARLSRERQLDVCRQCHLEITSRMTSSLPRYGRAPFSYRPGEPLSDAFVYFDYPPGAGRDERFEIVNAGYRLPMSKCFQSSQMTCTTCHDPHNIPRGQDAVEHYPAVCRTCHAAEHAPVAGKAINAKTSCIDCHMAKRRTDDVVHAVMTDHFIQRRKPAGDLTAPLEEVKFARFNKAAGDVVPYHPADPPKDEDRLYLEIAQVQDAADPAPALNRLEQDLTRKPVSGPEFAYELAKGYEKAGHHDQAIRWYDESLRIDPGFRPAIDGLGLALIEAGDLDRAAAFLEKAVSSGPVDPIALTNLGNVYLKTGRTEAAQRVLTRELGANPDRPEALNLLGMAAATKQDAPGAKQDFNQALAIQPDLAAAHYNLANLLAAEGEYDQPRWHFEETVGIEPDNADSQDHYGLLLAKAGLYAKALAEFREAIRLNPNLATAHADLAAVLSAQGHYPAAAGEYRRALELDPNDYEAHLALGMIMLQSGNKAEAGNHLQMAARSPDPEVRDAAQQALR